jgi:hypothetical protein
VHRSCRESFGKPELKRTRGLTLDGSIKWQTFAFHIVGHFFTPFSKEEILPAEFHFGMGQSGVFP